MAAESYSRIIEALEVAYNARVADARVKAESYDFLQQIVSDTTQLGGLWQWYLELTEGLRTPGGSGVHEVRFWILQTCEKQILDSSDAGLKQAISEQLLQRYFIELLPELRLLGVEADWVVSRCTSVQVALVAADFPAQQPHIFSAHLNAIEQAHRELQGAPVIETQQAGARLIALVDAFLEMLSQLDATYIRDDLSCRSKEERDLANKLKDGLRESGAVAVILGLLASIVSGQIFGVQAKLNEVIVSDQPAALPGYWVKSARRAAQIYSQFCVWADIALLLNPSIRMFVELALDYKFGLKLAEGCLEVVQALSYKRMHWLAKATLLREYGALPLLNKAYPSAAKESDPDYESYANQYAMSLNTVALEIVECFTDSVLPSTPPTEEQLSHLRTVGGSLEQSEGASAMLWDYMEATVKLCASLLAGKNMQAAERIMPALKDALSAIVRQLKKAGGEGPPNMRATLEQVLAACIVRVRIPDAISWEDVHDGSYFDVDEDDGSEISEFFVCRKLALGVYTRAINLGITLSKTADYCVEFLELCLYELLAKAQAGEWRVVEAVLCLFSETLDGVRDAWKSIDKLRDIMITARTRCIAAATPPIVVLRYIEVLAKLAHLVETSPVSARLPITIVPLVKLNLLPTRYLVSTIIKDLVRCGKILSKCQPQEGNTWYEYMRDQGVIVCNPLPLAVLPADKLIWSDEDFNNARCTDAQNPNLSVEDVGRVCELLGDCVVQHDNVEVVRDLLTRLIASVPSAPPGASIAELNQNIELAARQLRCIGNLLHYKTAGCESVIHAYVVHLLEVFKGNGRVISNALLVLRRLMGFKPKASMYLYEVLARVNSCVTDLEGVQQPPEAVGPLIERLVGFYTGLFAKWETLIFPYCIMTPNETDEPLIVSMIRSCTILWRSVFSQSTNTKLAGQVFNNIAELYCHLASRQPHAAFVLMLMSEPSNPYSLAEFLGTALEMAGSNWAAVAPLVGANVALATLALGPERWPNYVKKMAEFQPRLAGMAERADLQQTLLRSFGKFSPERVVRLVLRTFSEPVTDANRIWMLKACEQVGVLIRLLGAGMTFEGRVVVPGEWTVLPVGPEVIEALRRATNSRQCRDVIFQHAQSAQRR